MRFWLRAALASFALVNSLVAVAKQQTDRLPPGFATTRGKIFQVDGKPFAFVGANSYWLPLLTTKVDVERTFKEMQGAGIKVLRTWGFNAILPEELPYALESGLTYYQLWNGTDWTLNDGEQGLKRLDNVIATAGKYGIKVILAFTNNWVGYGSMELYLAASGVANPTHDVFYTNEKVIASYQRYVKTIVQRYKNSPNIFAWELMNEARCLGDLPGGPNCVPGSELLTSWYRSQSDFVRKLDPYHLITTGGEGHFYWPKHPGYWYNHTLVSDYNYDGRAGEDFDLDLTLDNIDFGTYHIYPQYWYSQLDTPSRKNFTVGDWGVEWISQHARSAARIGKPVILEEYGLFGFENKTSVFPKWVNRALETGHAIMPWQFGTLGLTEHGGTHLFKYADWIIDGASPNDGHTYYRNQTELWNLYVRAAKIQAARTR